MMIEHHRLSPSPGTAMGAPPSEIDQSWGPGWGVRLLDRLISEHQEK